MSVRLAAWTNSGLVILARLCDDCGHCPSDRKCLTEQVLLHSRFEVPLESSVGSRGQAQGETEEAMSKGGSVGIKAEALSCSSSASRGRCWWRVGICWRDAFTLHIRVDSTPWELLELSFHVIQQLVLDLKISGLFGGRHFALKLAALPQRPEHVHTHTASMRPDAHSWSNPLATFRWRVRFPTP